MKILFLIFIIFFCNPIIKAQTVSTELIGASGGFYSNGELKMDWAVGEIATEIMMQSQISMDQGLLQTIFISSLPQNASISGVYSLENDTCVGAYNTIAVNDLVLLPGSIMQLIAGEKIVFSASINVSSGAYLHAFISVDGEYCFQPEALLSSARQNEITEYLHENKDESENSFIIFPNPTQGHTTLKSTAKPPSLIEIEIYNTLGKRMFHYNGPGQETYTINLGAFSQGLYFVRCYDGKEVWIDKVIKN